MTANDSNTTDPNLPQAPVERGVVAAHAASETASELPKWIGDFEVEGRIGRGGMSHVFRAHRRGDTTPVAVKVMDATFAAESAMRQRFLREVKAIQSLTHPNIVPLSAYGAENGVPYLVMPFIEGATLSELIQYLKYIRRESEIAEDDNDTLHNTDGSTCAGFPDHINTAAGACFAAARHHDSEFQDLAELIAVAADALNEAHRRGIVHRDIKPSNIMIDRQGRLWLADFGLASIGEAQTVVTKTGEMIGTPHYMSPEQVSADHNLIDHRTDIYSLGATLYELITLRRPHQGDRFRVLMEISTGRLSPPSRIRSDIPKPLEAIVLKAMQYSPLDRYQSGEAMADDLRRFARGKVISARQPHMSDHVVRWLVRNPRTTIASILGVMTAIILLIGGMLVYSNHLEAHSEQLQQFYASMEEVTQDLAVTNEELKESQRELKRHLYVANLAAAYRFYALRDVDAVQQLLSLYTPQPSLAKEQGQGTDSAEPDLRGFECRLLENLCRPPDGRELGRHRGSAYEVVLVPGQDACLTAGEDGSVCLWNLAGDEPPITSHLGANLNALAIAPDGATYVTGRNVSASSNGLAILRMEDGKVAHDLKRHKHSVESAAYSPDGKLIATADRYMDVFLHNADGTFRKPFKTGSRNESLAFSPDGQYLVAVVREENGANQKVTLLSLPELNPTREIPVGFSPSVFAFSGDGKRIVIANGDGLALCNWPDGKTLFAQREVRGRLRCVALNHDGSKICAGCDNGLLLVWDHGGISKNDLSSNEAALPVAIVTGKQAITSLAVTDDDRVVLTTEGGSVQVWQTNTKREVPRKLDQVVANAAYSSRDVDEMVVRRKDGSVAKLDLVNLQFKTLQTVPADPHLHVARSPDGRFVVASTPGELIAIDGHSGEVISRITVLIRNDPTDGLAFTSDGTQLLHLLNDRFEVYGVGQRAEDWRRTDEVKLDHDGVRKIAVSPATNRSLVAITTTSDLIVYERKESGFETLVRIPPQYGGFSSARFSEDGELLALGHIDGTVQVLQTTSDFQELSLMLGHRTTVNDSAFVDHGQTLITASDDQIRFWDTTSGREMGAIAVQHRVWQLHFSAARDSLYCFIDGSPVEVWTAKH